MTFISHLEFFFLVRMKFRIFKLARKLLIDVFLAGGNRGLRSIYGGSARGPRGISVSLGDGSGRMFLSEIPFHRGFSMRRSRGTL